MKKTLTLSSLALLAATATIELARNSSVQLPDVLNVGNAFIGFAALLLTLVVLADYGAKVRPIPLPARTRLARPRARASIAAAHHHVYAIRRGVEAARLGTPNRIVVFPRRESAHCRRAA